MDVVFVKSQTFRDSLWVQIISVLFLLVYVAVDILVVYQALSSPYSTINHIIAYFIAIICVPSLIFFALFRHLRQLQTRDRRRQLAANGVGDAIDLTALTGDVAPEMLAVPTTIRCHLAWRLVGGIFGGLALLLVILAFGYGWRSPSGTVSWESIWSALIIVGFFAVIFALMAAIVRLRITATENGLTIWRPWRTQTISWTEARLFALHTEPGQSGYYELASATAILRWSYVGDQSLLAPAEGRAYQGRMDALLLIIQLRTGLALYKT